MGVGLAGGIVIGLSLDIYLKHVNKAEAKEEVVATTTPKVVEIKVIYSSEESIERLIRETFPEQPELAVAIARCESGLVPDIQSHHMQEYGRERSFGLFQVHEPDWADDAERLGLDDWRTDVEENVKLARYIYEKAGKSFRPWSCLKLI